MLRLKLNHGALEQRFFPLKFGVRTGTYLNINSRDNFIQASPRIEDSAPRVDIKCVNVDYEGWVSYLLGRKFFWSVFEKRDVPKDGHCFIKSLILSLSALSPDLPCLSYEHALTMIRNEINLNSETYSSLLRDHGNSKVNEIINQYLNNKNYDEHFGDLVPIITNGATDEVYKWISNFTVHFVMDVIIYSCCDKS